MEVKIKHHNFKLLEEKCLLWLDREALLIADLHLGKVNHFRKSGIPVPNKPNDENIERLIMLLQTVRPKRVLFMGDLFHSHYNTEWEIFGEVLKYFPETQFELIVGNHDILSNYQYTKNKLVLHDKPLIENGLILSHEPLDTLADDQYNIAGHIHPGVRLKGKGRQHLTLPCFYFGKQQALLPAFGQFTGIAKIKPQKGDKVIVIVDGRLMEV
ncbi:ligase-associated DNA damage response endonuclease PdeM [Fulvivirga sp. M361]|uniref:ligase-associated DNA damage response endonuclease PdeM n=1 Tax=Fulvivirga sp. M361 TaxID=2594266 RepID=UPI00162A805C|nr:ligase-associated DNA damage response endonuclease PdeM [Fulvivirga sp. M361]